MSSLACSLSTPTTTRSGFMKSVMAEPSLRNSGLLATSNGILTPRLSSSSWMTALTFFAVPTGTVDLVTRTVYFLMFWPKVRATASTYCRSAEPSSSGGVPTALKTISTSSRMLARSVVNLSLPSRWFLRTISSRPGSYMGISPFWRDSILAWFTSTQVTLTPISAKHVPLTSPT